MMNTVPTGLDSWNFEIFDGPSKVTSTHIPLPPDKAIFSINGCEYLVYRKGTLRGDYVLSCNGSIQALATKPSGLYRHFDITYQGNHYHLNAVSPCSRHFEFGNETQTLGVIREESPLSYRSHINLPSTLPLELRIFATCLVALTWIRDQQTQVPLAAS